LKDPEIFLAIMGRRLLVSGFYRGKG